MSFDIIKHYNRQEVKKHYTDEFFYYNECQLRSAIQSAVDGGYCYGYNIVLEACRDVFGLDSEEYWKVVDKLEEYEKENEE